MALFHADVDLARAGDLLFGIRSISSHCASQPTVRGIANSTVNMLGPEAHGLVDDAGVEVDVRDTVCA